MASTREKLDRLLSDRSKPAPGKKKTTSRELAEHPDLADTVRPSSAKDGLARVEKEVLGRAAADTGSLSVKQRLERLIEATERRGHSGPARAASRTSPQSRGRAISLSELVPAEEIQNELGNFLCIDRRYPLDHYHGKSRIDRVFELSPDAFALLSGGLSGSEETELNLDRTVFLDTETTGLAGGSGTCAFLVGLGYLDEGSFLIRQFFMRDYHEEAAMLSELASLLPRFEALVTYNGKSYDVPLLESRFILSRQRFSFEKFMHFDLLHPARNLWKRRFESCRLTELEYVLLGLEREGDVPGHQIPELYFSYLRSGRAQRIEGVLTHNRYDILSLAALTARAGEMLDESHVPDNPMDDYSLGRLFERAQLSERSMLHYRRAMEMGLEGSAKSQALVQIALQHKRVEEWDEAERLWREITTEEGEQAIGAWSELAMLYEHRRRDFKSALESCEEALGQLSHRYDWPLSFREKWTEAFQHRRLRLRRRQSEDGHSAPPQQPLPNG